MGKITEIIEAVMDFFVSVVGGGGGEKGGIRNKQTLGGDRSFKRPKGLGRAKKALYEADPLHKLGNYDPSQSYSDSIKSQYKEAMSSGSGIARSTKQAKAMRSRSSAARTDAERALMEGKASRKKNVSLFGRNSVVETSQERDAKQLRPTTPHAKTPKQSNQPGNSGGSPRSLNRFGGRNDSWR